jgi:hypothetical protein
MAFRPCAKSTFQQVLTKTADACARQFSLVLRQQPKHSRMCGFGEKGKY